MAIGAGPFSEWEAAIARSPYRTLHVDSSRTVDHWNDVASRYDCGSVSMIDERMWDILEQDSLVPQGGTVLDIGCGTGSISRLFASAGANVLGLDISPGMLSVARRKCADLPQVDLKCQDWRDFSGGPDFDLVFSSFCPAVDDPSSILRMESLSRGRCCLVSLSGPADDRSVLEMLEKAGHSGLSFESYDPSYPFHVLEGLGRAPVLRSFSIGQEYEVSADDMMDHMVCCMGLFLDITPEVRRSIRSSILGMAEDGVLNIRDRRTVSVLHWRSPASTAPW